MTDPLNATARQRLMAIGLMVIAVSCFSFLDTTAKYLSLTLPTLEVVWARYVGAFVLAIILSNPISHPGLMRTSRPVLQVFRSALLVGSTLLNFVALRYLQLDEAVSIIFSAPFLVAALSGPILGEWISWQRWVAICTAFIGVLVVTHPFDGGIHPAALLSFGSVVCYAVYMIATRTLARTDSSETTLFYSNVVGAVITSLMVPFVWVTPDGWFTVALMVLIGAFGSVGHYLLIIAHRYAPAAILSPFIYTQLLGMIVLGYLIFGDVPNQWTLIGAAIVIASGLYLLSLETKGFRRQT
jgi:drug/metabolite transporter (DMT)-like permease